MNIKIFSKFYYMIDNILIIFIIYVLSIFFTKVIDKITNGPKLLLQEIDKQTKDYELKQTLENRDKNVAVDVMTPPERRLPIRNIPPQQVQNKFWKSTKGLPENYQYVGNIVSETSDKILPIFGREDYPRSDFWEYYIIYNQNDNFGIKIPINKNPIRELEEDADIELDYFPGEVFKYKPFEIESIKYNPYNY